MSILPHSVTAGSLTTPYGGEGEGVDVSGGTASYSESWLQNTRAAGDGAGATFAMGYPVYRARLRGVLSEGTKKLGSTFTGTLSIELDTGEKWSGTVLITNLRKQLQHGPVSRGNGRVPVTFDALFTGPVSIE